MGLMSHLPVSKGLDQTYLLLIIEFLLFLFNELFKKIDDYVQNSTKYYRRRLTRQTKFKFWMKLFAFHFVLRSWTIGQGRLDLIEKGILDLIE